MALCKGCRTFSVEHFDVENLPWSMGKCIVEHFLSKTVCFPMNILSHIDAVSFTTKHFQECPYEHHAVDALSPSKWQLYIKSDTYNAYNKAASMLHKDIEREKCSVIMPQLMSKMWGIFLAHHAHVFPVCWRVCGL